MSVLLGFELRGPELSLTVVNRRGEVDAFAIEPLATPLQDWWGAHPEEYHRAIRRILETSRREGHFIGADVAGIGLVGEPALVLLDRELRVIPPREIWGESKEVPPSPGALLRALAANGFPEHGDTRRTLRSVGMVLSLVDYLRFRMTGALATSATFAWGLGLTAPEEATTWDRAAIEALGFSVDAFPPILTADCRVGVVSEKLVELAGISRGVWVNAGSDPVSARLLVAGEPKEDGRVAIDDGERVHVYAKCEPAAESAIPLPVPGLWYRSIASAADLPQAVGEWSEAGVEENAVVDAIHPERLERLPDDLSPAVGVAFDAGGPSAGAAIQAGLGLGWWRDLRALWRKRRAPQPWEAWRVARAEE